MTDELNVQEVQAIVNEYRGLNRDTLLHLAVKQTVDLKNHQLKTAKRVITEKEDLSDLHSNVRILGEKVTNLETQMQRIEAQNNQILALLIQQQQNVPAQSNIKVEPKLEPLWYHQPYDGNNSNYDNPNGNGHCYKDIFNLPRRSQLLLSEYT